ncbi:hypothetical protein SRRS_00300 [Sporomusa rhizae]|uniref:hypothetical protein n=1 Tax=Sporomusa rhizae TaxID=357999 RepID=UPI00352B728F
MNYYFSWKAEKGIDVNPGDYFETAIIADEKILPETVGRDEYNLGGMLLPEKRVAGFGRVKTYNLGNLPAGLGPIEAEPSKKVVLQEDILPKVAFRIATNIILDQGLLAQYLCLDVTRDDGTSIQIPLSRPDVAISWQSRGDYIVTAQI